MPVPEERLEATTRALVDESRLFNIVVAQSNACLLNYGDEGGPPFPRLLIGSTLRVYPLLFIEWKEPCVFISFLFDSECVFITFLFASVW